MQLLRTLCQLAAPSGHEAPLTHFLLDYVHQHQATWHVPPTILAGEGWQDCLLLVFGQPRTAVFAHLDSIGYTVRYGRQLVRIGGPAAAAGTRLVGQDARGAIDCTLTIDEQTGELGYEFTRDIDRGTELTYYCNFRETATTVQSCYLDNRLGVWNAPAPVRDAGARRRGLWLLGGARRRLGGLPGAVPLRHLRRAPGPDFGHHLGVGGRAAGPGARPFPCATR